MLRRKPAPTSGSRSTALASVCNSLCVCMAVYVPYMHVFICGSQSNTFHAAHKPPLYPCGEISIFPSEREENISGEIKFQKSKQEPSRLSISVREAHVLFPCMQ
ncbi:hypothetical protein ATANTOWER_006166 [Ataeniobius toweri]|uniref:Secreted protein n=1 Tax=Ataeniobius toweri TaxID=208326 RepID=A0ABU7ADI7_9TELE|nr:hypothetical protein [Ataeniobius toweri]